MKTRPVILCGGSGTRLWPESRENFPKQFIPIKDGCSLFDLTLKRLNLIKNLLTPIIITNEKYKFLVKDSLENLKLKASIVLEPLGKNTAPAIYIASKLVNEKENLLILPSDHYIGKNDVFSKAINNIIKLNQKTNWVTLGITPNFPSTSYGYIKLDENSLSKKIIDVKGFVEKPNSIEAKQLLSSKNTLWNSGIFFGNAKMILKSIQKHAPSISKNCDLVFKRLKFSKKLNEYSFDIKLFKKIPSVPIDKAVMEKSCNVSCYPIKCEWNDVGSWERFFECFPIRNNSKKLVQVKSKNNLIKTDKRLIATIGVKDLIIVDSNDATLIAKKGLEENMRELISTMSNKNIPEIKENIFENRPWGKFENLIVSKNLKIKKISVNPKSKLSKQFHYFRSEHWFITQGKGLIFLDGKTQILKKGNSIDIPKKSIHYIENQTDKILTFIEIQMGTYFGEDDIVRIDDFYGRK